MNLKKEIEKKTKKEIERFEKRCKKEFEKNKKELKEKYRKEIQRLEARYKEKLRPFEEVYKKKIKQIQEITDALTMVENQIMGERMQTPQDSNDLQKRLADAQLTLENIEKQIKAKKREIKSLKSSIDEKKQAYESQPDSEKNPEKWAKVSEEIEPLGDQIVDGESEIGALEMQKFTAEQDVEMAKVNIEAFNEGVHEKPVEEDPRMREVLRKKRRMERHMRRIERLSARAK